MFSQVANCHDKQTRLSTNNDLAIPRKNLTTGQHYNIRYYGVKVWQNTDQEIKQSTNLDEFKKALYKK